MKKRRANNLSVGDSVDQLKIADPAQAGEFALNALVGCSIESRSIRKHRVIIGDLFKNGSGFAVPGGNQPVHSFLAELPDRRRQRPPRHASSIRRTSAMPGWPWRSR